MPFVVGPNKDLDRMQAFTFGFMFGGGGAVKNHWISILPSLIYSSYIGGIFIDYKKNTPLLKSKQREVRSDLIDSFWCYTFYGLGVGSGYVLANLDKVISFSQRNSSILNDSLEQLVK